MAGTLPALTTLAAANGLYLVLLLLGGMVIPLDELPSGLRAVAEALPAGALSRRVPRRAGRRLGAGAALDRPGRVGGRRAAGRGAAASAGSEHGRQERSDAPLGLGRAGERTSRASPVRPPAEPPAMTGPVAVVRR